MKIRVILEGEDYNKLTFIFEDWACLSTFVKYAIANGNVKVTIEEVKDGPFA